VPTWRRSPAIAGVLTGDSKSSTVQRTAPVARSTARSRRVESATQTASGPTAGVSERPSPPMSVRHRTLPSDASRAYSDAEPIPPGTKTVPSAAAGAAFSGRTRVPGRLLCAT
jgi:hypothetical protein